MTLFDTTSLISCFVEPGLHSATLRRAIADGERFLIPTLVLYEWWRGPRRPEELATQEVLFPSRLAVPFGPEEAALSARLYRTVARPRGREIDLGIAACAILRQAQVWTLNPADFKDIPGLRLASFS